MTSQNLRILGWAVPLLCMAGASYATYGQYHRLQVDQSLRDAKQREFATSVETLNQARLKVEKEGRYAAVPRIDAEETQFLGDLRQRATKAGVEIVSWRTSTSKASENAKEKDPKNDALLKGIDRITSDLTVEGAYSPIRAFVEDLNQTTRLYTINNAQWQRGDKGGTQLTITVSRYVTEPPGSTQPTRTEANL